MKNKSRLLIFIFLLLALRLSYGEGVFLRDPLTAGIISILQPGLGQIYNENLLEGTGILILHKTLLYLIMIETGNIYPIVSFPGSYLAWNYKGLNSLEELVRTSVWTTCILAIYSYSTIDAVKGAMNLKTPQLPLKSNMLYQYLKDHFIAYTLSYSFPGLGQFYVSDYSMGTLFFLLDSISFSIQMLLVWQIDVRRGLPFGYPVRWENLDTTEKSIFVANIVFYELLRISSAVLAFKKAEKYNKKFFSVQNFTINVSPYSFSLAYETRI